MEIKLIVIRSADPEKLADFYAMLGLTFEYHQHQSSPFHYSAQLGSAILEIYPLSRSQVASDPFLRLGFRLDHFDETVGVLKKLGVRFVSEPAPSDFGFMAVIEDPEGRKLELYR